jgi:CRP-like cAMP-binding protein
VDTPEIMRLTAVVPDTYVAGGTVLLREGERSGALFVLVSGVLEVRRRGIAVVDISDPGAIVGELGLLLDSPASADVVAVGDAVVRRVDDAEQWLVRAPELGRHLATLLARRLWQISNYLTDLQEQFADRGEVLGLMPAVLRELIGRQPPLFEPGSEREVESPY